MAFIDEVLQVPSYGWKNEKGELVKPNLKELYAEAFSRINIFKTKKNWISAINWFVTLCMMPFFLLFLFKYFSLGMLAAFLLYSMIIMSTHGTIWFHRYATHKAYTFSHPFWRFLTQNLVVRTFPEELYVVSHHVHHSLSDEPGDPYNARAGFWYCMLADVNHQSISKTLSEADYKKATNFMSHTGVPMHSYTQYKKWGSITKPLPFILHWFANWAFWYGAFYLAGGHALACTLFAAAMFWFIFVRAFNYTGHGKGEVKHQDGIDFDRSNLSINQSRPGWFSGEWHNNHHLYPGSARAGFLPYQLDLAWLYILGMYKLGAVASYRDSKPLFMKNYWAKYKGEAGKTPEATEHAAVEA
ncbi:MAG: fatty acid desaturase [Hymenobacteraceae bacterium]|nr:fatty acid desaturase [Hymenobacteraceae bacterium]MDX5397703.1 fatty acid desaturase [Hymenobacteraceae bacterium]MDX5444252.1 fatty acid desaturase [Hymenobacteraceae bacterium]MDX5513781.1 fatty acid desaturase [Hymenobacteraceae bacterium]